MKKIKKKPLFVRVKTGTHAFRTWSVDLELYDPNAQTGIKEFVLYNGEWTNKTREYSFETKRFVENWLDSYLSLTGFKSYRSNGEFAWVKGIAFNNEEKFLSWADSVKESLTNAMKNAEFEWLQKNIL